VTLSLATAVKGDTGNILNQAIGAHDTAACIDRKLAGSAGGDGDCRGAATPASAARQRSAARSGELPARLKNLFKDQADLRKKIEERAKALQNAPAPTPNSAPTNPLPKVGRQLQDRLNGILGNLKGNGANNGGNNTTGNALLDRLLRTLKLQKGGE
jgi:hypothetical protein